MTGGRQAFTLVEALATLVLIAIILPVAMKGISLATSTAGLAKQRMEAAALAETTLAETMATGAWQDGDVNGDFEPDAAGYRWAVEVQDWEATTLKQVTVRVEWTARGTDRSVTLSTLVYTREQ